MRRAVLLAAALAACGVKAPPRPPLREAPDAGASNANPNSNPNSTSNANSPDAGTP